MTRHGSLVIVLSLILGACSGSKSPTELIHSAKQYIDNNEIPAAEIELKMAIQESPNLAEARYLLGKIYLDTGKTASAEKELAKAIELGFDINSAAPALAKAFSLQDKSNEIIELADSNPNLSFIAKQQTNYYLLLAYVNQGRIKDARTLILEAKKNSKNTQFSALTAIYDLIDKAEVTQALSELDELIKKHPNFDEALLLKGQLALKSAEYQQSASALQEYLKYIPTDNKARFYLAEALFKLRDMDKTEVQVDKLLTIAKEHPYLNQLKGSILFGRKDYEQAKIHLEKAVQNGSVHTATRLLAGITDFNLGNLEQSYQHLIAINNELPSDHLGKKLLGVVQLKLGYDIEAADSLLELEKMSKQDASLFAHASFELLKEGKLDQAKALLENAEKVSSNDPLNLARIGFLKLSLDDITGLEDLEVALNENPDIPIAKLSIAQAYLLQHRYEDALKLATEWIEADPDEIAGYNLSGITNLKMGNIALAESSFQKALEISPTNVASLNYFINKSIQSEDYEKAQQLATQITDAWPTYLPGLIQNFSISKKIGNTVESLGLLKRASDNNDSDIRYKSAYIRALVFENKTNTIIGELSNLSKDKIEQMGSIYWLALGDSYTSTEQPQKALNIYENWQSSSPENKTAWLKAIVIYDSIKQPTDALRVVKKARHYHSEDGQLALLEIYYNLMLAKSTTAQNLINKLPAEIKNLEETKGLQGQVYLMAKEYSKAKPLLIAQYKNFPTSNAAIHLFQLYQGLKKNQDGLNVLEKHIETYPKDLKVTTLLADRYLRQMSEKAVPLYKNLIEINENNTFALNNLAWLLSVKNKLDEAELYARKAVTIAPNNPHILDTLGNILVKQGNKTEAIKVLKQALNFAPNDKIITVSLKRAEAL